jgi:DNA-binding NarL/FixJ family response regulator
MTVAGGGTLFFPTGERCGAGALSRCTLQEQADAAPMSKQRRDTSVVNIDIADIASIETRRFLRHLCVVSSDGHPALKPTTVVVAEDHASIRMMVVRLLESSGRYRVLQQLSDGTQVAEVCEKLRPQLLIVDVDMPGRGGLDVARDVRAKSPDTHILIFTGLTDPRTIREAIEAGVEGMIEKSAPLEEFERAVALVSIGREYFGDSVNQSLSLFLDPTSTGRSDGRLSMRESEILTFVADGLSNKEMADRLRLSVKTIQNHRHRLMQKIGARNGADLARKAFDLGLLRRYPQPPKG